MGLVCPKARWFAGRWKTVACPRQRAAAQQDSVTGKSNSDAATAGVPEADARSTTFPLQTISKTSKGTMLLARAATRTRPALADTTEPGGSPLTRRLKSGPLVTNDRPARK